MPATRPPETPLILTAIARASLRLFGWRVEGAVPNVPKMVIVGAPHTSNIDGLIMFFVARVYRIRLRWIGKHTLFWPPLGWLLRWLGGIPINRTASRGAVQQMIDTFAASDRLVLLVTPEGTRGKSSRWKTGFYHIAQGAGVPIVLGSIDYRRKVVGIGPVITPTGDYETDMQVVQAYYQDKVGRYPEKRTLPLGDTDQEKGG